MVSIDQYISAALERLLKSKRKEPKKDKYCGGTLFVDHASGKIFASHQVSLRAGETVLSKRMFEWLAAKEGVQIKAYHADNVPFDSQEFRADIKSKQQRLVLSGTQSEQCCRAVNPNCCCVGKNDDVARHLALARESRHKLVAMRSPLCHLCMECVTKQEDALVTQ
jgi:hypothetical protein